MIAQQTKKAL
jgi:superfamily II DNA helicase RecQ